MEKQKFYNSCMACVLGMIINKSEEYVLNWFKYYGPPFNNQDAFIFLAHHGIFFGIAFEEIHFQEDDIHGIMSIKERPLLITVKSENYEDKTHAIYWDGFQIKDPCPTTKKTKIKEYEIKEIYPLLRTKERLKMAKDLSLIIKK